MVTDSRSIRQKVGLFTVHKKGKAQRLVIDARGSNFWFVEPDSVSLASGSSLSSVELQPHEDL